MSVGSDRRDETIVALSSGKGRAAIGVIRLSGTLVPEILARMNVPLKSRFASFVSLKHPKEDIALDKCVAIYFEAPNSYTGEAIGEFHLHGSIVTINAVIEALVAIDGVRLAEAGEFTRRALENGKLGLLEAEAVGELIDADVASQQQQALHQLFGHSQTTATKWRQDLIGSMAYIEAQLDFVDESDVDEEIPDEVWANVRALQKEISAVIARSKAGERIKDGIKVVLVGAPNAGKSSLLNYLVHREAAIVSPIAGTTRDIVEVQLDLKGYAFTLSDTAGLRETTDEIEQEGVKRAQTAIENADIVVHMSALDQPVDEIELNVHNQALLVKVQSKTDLSSGQTADIILEDPEILPISIKTGLGIDGLIKVLVDFAEKQQMSGDDFIVTRARHRVELVACEHQLNLALSDLDLEVRAEALRSAARALGRLIGVVDHEHVLDELFSGFCIGK